MQPLFIMGENVDGSFQRGFKGKAGATLRCSWANVRLDDYSELTPFLKMLPKGTAIHLGMCPMPCPADILSVTISGTAYACSFEEAVYLAYVDDLQKLANFIVQQGFEFHGARASASTLAPKDEEFAYVGGGDIAAETIWAAAGYRPSLAMDAQVALVASMEGFVPHISMPTLDPRNSALRIDESGNIVGTPNKNWGTELLTAMVAGVSFGVLSPMDLNLGLHPLSDMVKTLGEKSGIYAVQLHITVGDANVADWVTEANTGNPAWIEVHQNQAVAA